MNKLIIIIIAVTIIVGGGSFYGGVKYAESKNSQNRLPQANFQNLQNLSSEERQVMLQNLGTNAGGSRVGKTGGQTGGNFISGEIISKDDKSVTVKLQDGGSKIIFFSDSTEITKLAQGFLNDLTVGAQISVNGTANSDGSATAQTIQLRPTLNQ